IILLIMEKRVSSVTLYNIKGVFRFEKFKTRRLVVACDSTTLKFTLAQHIYHNGEVWTCNKNKRFLLGNIIIVTTRFPAQAQIFGPTFTDAQALLKENSTQFEQENEALRARLKVESEKIRSLVYIPDYLLSVETLRNPLYHMTKSCNW
ncbi:hypothetical protein ACJX0J_008043, partial [Zea mays]